MGVLTKYDMQMAINITVWMYADGNTEVEWLPVGNSKNKKLRSSIEVDGTATDAVIRNISGTKQQLVRLRPILKCS